LTRTPTRTAATGAPAASSYPLWGALAIVYVVWGSTYLGIRVVAASLPAFGSAALRFAVAAGLLAIVIAVARGWRTLHVTWRQCAAAAMVGALLIAGGNGMVVLAESPQVALASGVAALLVALNPLVMVLLGTVTGDRPRPRVAAGVVAGLTGVVLLFLPALRGGEDAGALPVLGGILVIVGVLCWCVGSFATRWLSMPTNPFVASVYGMFAGAAALAVIALIRGERAPWAMPDVPAKAWLALAYLIVAGSLVAFTAYVYLLHHASISLTSTHAYVNPVIALALGALLAGERLTAQVLLAAAAVICGVAVVVTAERPRAAVPVPAEGGAAPS
jgi:drug/metabolite transporter (DMT)-like permease